MRKNKVAAKGFYTMLLASFLYDTLLTTLSTKISGYVTCSMTSCKQEVTWCTYQGSFSRYLRSTINNIKLLHDVACNNIFRSPAKLAVEHWSNTFLGSLGWEKEKEVAIVWKVKHVSVWQFPPQKSIQGSGEWRTIIIVDYNLQLLPNELILTGRRSCSYMKSREHNQLLSNCCSFCNNCTICVRN